MAVPLAILALRGKAMIDVSDTLSETHNARRLSIIVPLRDRSDIRLDNCLSSLRWQDFDEDDVEIILSDFGSTPAFQEKTSELAERYRATVISHDTSETWNRSRALNIGIRSARGHYVLCTDADMIFAPNFLATLVTVQSKARDTAFIVSLIRDLPKDVVQRAYARSDFASLLAASEYRPGLGTGPCHMAPRSMFESLRGYDEGYKFWGQEDNDMMFRAQYSGMALRWVHDKTAMLHQWHPSDRGTRPIRKFLNDVRYHLTSRRIKKNPGTWGALP